MYGSRSSVLDQPAASSARSGPVTGASTGVRETNSYSPFWSCKFVPQSFVRADDLQDDSSNINGWEMNLGRVDDLQDDDSFRIIYVSLLFECFP